MTATAGHAGRELAEPLPEVATEAERAAYARGQADAFEEAARVCEAPREVVLSYLGGYAACARDIRALARAAEQYERVNRHD